MFEQIKKILVDELQVNADYVTPEAELIADLGINSLELADLALLCEERYNIEIDENAIGNFVTVADVVDYLSKNVK